MKQKYKELFTAYFFLSMFVTGFLQLVFLALKLIKVITWDWFFVFSPYLGLAVLIAISVLIFNLFKEKD